MQAELPPPPWTAFVWRSNWRKNIVPKRESVDVLFQIKYNVLYCSTAKKETKANTVFGDTLAATRAALEEGIVMGGGSALVEVSKALDKIPSDLTEDEKAGFKIVRRALEEPIRQIAENAGLDGAVIADKAKNAAKGVGFNAATQEWVDMLESGIIDPAKVTRSALQNAASVAGLLLTTECVITSIPEKETAAPANPGTMM